MPVAFVAAYLLVLQSMLGAFASAIEQNAPQLDAFGNVICTHDGAAQLPDGDRHPPHPPECCTIGCSMLSHAYVPPPAAGTLPGSLPFQDVAFLLPAFRHLDFARARSPSNPRAPPQTA
jgi:hypothetical protein